MKFNPEKHLSPEALANLQLWLHDPDFQEYNAGLEQFLETENWPEIEDSFYTHLTVGTGGIRGRLGIGPNRINKRIIAEAAQGLSEFMKTFGADALKGGVVVGYEIRKESLDFARLCCEIFAGNGIKAQLFPHFCSTPEVSFAVRHLGVTAGVMITASHNPKTDNGFKFYWSDGGQVVPPLDTKFMECVTAVRSIPRMQFEEAERQSLVSYVSEDVDVAYIAAICALSLTKNRSAHIVYSPLHAAGSTNVLPVLRKEKFDVDVVPQQAEPDETFPTAKGTLINPEYDEVMAPALAYGKEQHADIVLVSDPDADRLGVAVREGDGFIRYSGNEVGAILVYYILSQRKAENTIPSHGLMLKTYVTTSLVEDIAKAFDVTVKGDLLVGFKYIAEIIEKLPDQMDFIFALEESLGYLAGTFTRDKDAAIASLYLCELASMLKDEGKTFVGYFKEIYEQFGYYKNTQLVREFAGKEGKSRIFTIMKKLRLEPPQSLGGQTVLRVIDRYVPKLDASTIDTYKVGKTGDQFTLVLSDDERNRITIRPSGTEPTLKCYIQMYAPPGENLEQRSKALDALVERMRQAMDQLITDIVS